MRQLFDAQCVLGFSSGKSFGTSSSFSSLPSRYDGYVDVKSHVSSPPSSAVPNLYRLRSVTALTYRSEAAAVKGVSRPHVWIPCAWIRMWHI
ncbi:putative 2-oxoglutarate/Fe(II)-dependent dioxygenase [Anopheles sinensis]|uniref:Putative 2-oxoglutarate/Fe(II)-dependent dioxygenase n=1 Tax=Anopheles sinensis TaxID=74873 RepID=A0A084VVN0_ANOSI|nr:putative 2-oxoglutarate/Fe(II)-dependent dioxygenase [Anopheles sinensis]